MQDRIKELAVEAGGVPMRENCLDAEAFPWGVEMEIDALERFANAVARECLALVNAEHLVEPSDSADDMAYDNAVRDCAQAIRARFGLGE